MNNNYVISSPSLLSSVPLHHTQISYQGKTYRIKRNVQKGGLIWRIKQFVLVIFLSLATFGIGLVFSSVRSALKAKWEQVLTGKFTTLRMVKIKESSPTKNISPLQIPKSSSKTQLEVALHQKYEEYFAIQKSTVIGNEVPINLCKLQLDIGDRDASFGTIHPDAGLACLLTLLDYKNSKACFIPDPHFIQIDPAYPALRPETDKGFDFLRNMLSTAFGCGKEFVVIRLCNTLHAVVAAFQSDGQFQIIDSMFNHTIDLNSLTTKLNQAQIKDAADQIIVFKGKIVNTGLQKGGHECIRFATLYGYQMVKEQSFDGYKRVNGAFADNLLQTFEDVDKIDTARSLSSGRKIDLKHYQPFMDSWAYRASNFLVDHWEDLMIKDLWFNRPENEWGIHLLDVYILTSPNSVTVHSINACTPLKLQDSSSPTCLPVADNWREISLGSLIPKGKEKIVILIKNPDSEHQKPLIFRLLEDQIIKGVAW